MGDPARANPAEIIDIPYLDDPQWKGVPDYLHYKANWLLIVDNLMLDADPDFKLLAIATDAPLAHFRRTLSKLIDEEEGTRRVT
jgi:hypothetical protein